LKVGGAADGPLGIAVDEFYLRSRNSERNDQNHHLRMTVHTYGGGLQLQALTTVCGCSLGGIPEARFMNARHGARCKETAKETADGNEERRLRRVSKDGPWASWFSGDAEHRPETALARLLAMRGYYFA